MSANFHEEPPGIGSARPIYPKEPNYTICVHVLAKSTGRNVVHGNFFVFFNLLFNRL